ncbi:MAG: NAD(+) diphosphatase [Xanthomonadales bacterium]|nr:NAD(+) diphosphatase [Xanthomonadales bacterium]
MLSVDQFTRSTRNRFSGVRLDRLVERRDDEAWVARTLGSSTARLVPLWRSRCLMAADGYGRRAVLLEPGELDALDSIQPPTLLGTDGEHTYFAVSVNERQRDQLLAAHPDSEFRDLRLAAVTMDASQAGVLAYAKALHYWQHRHSFCGVCGNPNRLRSAGHRLRCTNPECARETFPRIDPAIIVLVTHEDACMLGRNANWPPKRFSTLAGFVEPGESLEDAVVREIWEEARVRLKEIRYRSSQPWPFPASAMCGFYAEAEQRGGTPTDELSELRWFTAPELADAVRSGEVLLSPPVSIAFRLQADWFRMHGGGDLEAVLAEAPRPD